MRYLPFLLFSAAFFAACSNNDTPSAGSGNGPGAVKIDTANFTTVQWIDSTKDFGKIEEGQKLEVSFRFKNVGDKPLVIERVQPSCGCTVAEQSKDPVAPGAEGQVKASFNSEGRSGINHKTLFVYANAKGVSPHPLQFQVEVEKKKQ